MVHVEHTPPRAAYVRSSLWLHCDARDTCVCTYVPQHAIQWQDLLLSLPLNRCYSTWDKETAGQGSQAIRQLAEPGLISPNQLCGSSGAAIQPNAGFLSGNCKWCEGYTNSSSHKGPRRKQACTCCSTCAVRCPCGWLHHRSASCCWGQQTWGYCLPRSHTVCQGRLGRCGTGCSSGEERWERAGCPVLPV